jgi:hypothetical protein
MRKGQVRFLKAARGTCLSCSVLQKTSQKSKRVFRDLLVTFSGVRDPQGIVVVKTKEKSSLFEQLASCLGCHVI